MEYLSSPATAVATETRPNDQAGVTADAICDLVVEARSTTRTAQHDGTPEANAKDRAACDAVFDAVYLLARERDRYRGALEKLAQHPARSPHEVESIARQALEPTGPSPW